jgi:transposase
MLSLRLSEADAEIIKIERKTENSSLIRDRMEVLHLLHMGCSRQQTAKIVGCHPNSVTNYVKLYNEGGLEAIRHLSYSYPRHELREVYEQVDEVLEEANCSTVNDAREILASTFGYHRSHEAVRKLLHKRKFKHRKTGTFPGKIDNFEAWDAEQEACIKKLEGLIEQAEDEQLDLVFGDAAHFVYGKFSSSCWSKQPKYRPSGHGRHRINVYGAYDVATNQVYTMYNDHYIDAEFMVEYFEWLRDECYPDQNRPLHFVLDNARYQHCNYVEQCADRLNIELEFLPGYSPNLNLIERLWKYLKKKLGKQYHTSKASFEEGVVNLLAALDEDKEQEELRTLLSPNFQRFEKSQILRC